MEWGVASFVLDIEIYKKINPLMTNGLPRRYHLGESTLIFSGVRCVVLFFHRFFRWNISVQTEYPQNAASHLGLFCLPMSHIKDNGLK